VEQLSFFQVKTYGVGEITRYLKAIMEDDPTLQDIWVTGEISNLSRPASGHIYFTLKDEFASIRTVIWKVNAYHLKAQLLDGMKIEAHGSISVYEPAGQYQLYIDAIRPAGEGNLYQEFMRLKALLEAEGLFDPERKRPIPAHPQKIGIITSSTGAALQDVLNALERRYPLTDVVLAGVSVQGEKAPGEIVTALEQLNRVEHPDVILLVRGGGSIEDLWAFNDERVVRAIAASDAPIITGVGHETDFTLADFAADLRAPTPTAAAELATPEINEMRANFVSLVQHLQYVLISKINTLKMTLEAIRPRLMHASPLSKIFTACQNLDVLLERQGRAIEHSFELARTNLAGIQARLQTLSPDAILQRGYAIVTKMDGRIIRQSTQVIPNEHAQVRLAQGHLAVEVKKVIPD
jgi:exodeoxyribonuclease VII large subunit